MNRFEQLLHDAAIWPVNLIRDLPRRAGRLAGLWMVSPFAYQQGRAVHEPPLQNGQAVSRITHHATPSTLHAPRSSLLAFYLHALFCYFFDLIGGPEIVQFFWRLAADTRPLTANEITAAQAILGPQAIRYRDVRLAQGGFLTFVFRFNGGRAFATWHTVNMPPLDQQSDNYIALLVHELTHVYQYERVGTVYIGQALHSQRRMGRRAYDYGGPAGLAQARADGKRYSDYNREQQGQIAQDYHARLHAGADVTAYEPYIGDLRTGLF